MLNIIALMLVYDKYLTLGIAILIAHDEMTIP
jgi:hypothetical protein